MYICESRSSSGFYCSKPRSLTARGVLFLGGRPGARTSPGACPRKGTGTCRHPLLLTVLPAAGVSPPRGQTPAVESCLGIAPANRDRGQAPMRPHPPHVARCLSPQGDGHLQTSPASDRAACSVCQSPCGDRHPPWNPASAAHPPIVVTSRRPCARIRRTSPGACPRRGTGTCRHPQLLTAPPAPCVSPRAGTDTRCGILPRQHIRLS